MMDHAMVAQEQMTERYLLNELTPEIRDEFEEHFFSCAECASDVHVASLFIENSKKILPEKPSPGPVPRPLAVPDPRKLGWLAWLRPAFAGPMLAVLLAVVGYQNMVTYPQMSKALNTPEVLQWGSVNIGTYSASGEDITTAPGKGFLVFVRIPPQTGYSQRNVDLYNPAGQMEWSVSIPGVATQDRWPVAVPGKDRQPGTYKLVVRGTTASGTVEELGQGTFELHISK
jgi:hypothetical protein